MNSSSYRFDVRSPRKFARDIKSSHIKEVKIAIRLCIAIHSKSGKWPKLTPNGVDFTGKFISDNNKVTSEPDFKINNELVEITRSDVFCIRNFHQKTLKVDRCIKNNYILVFVNGYSAKKQPEYIWLDSKLLNELTIRSNTKYGKVLHPGAGKTGFINKAAFRYDTFWVKDLWQPLPALIVKDIPKEYKDILKTVGE